MENKTLSIYTYCDVIDCDLKVTYYANQNNRWSASIENCETKDGSILCGEYGNGDSPQSAIIDYIGRIQGKLIVINATSKEYRKEFTVPIYLTL